jgi:hypothetical protein
MELPVVIRTHSYQIAVERLPSEAMKQNYMVHFDVRFTIWLVERIWVFPLLSQIILLKPANSLKRSEMSHALFSY